MFDSLQPYGLQHYLPEFAQTHVHWVGDAIQLSHPLSSPSHLTFIFPASGSFPMSWLFASGGQSFSFNISPSKEYSGLIFFRIDWFDLLLSKGTLKKSSTPQFKSINSLALSLLYGPTLTSVRGYWKNHSFDCTDLCWQNDISAF